MQKPEYADATNKQDIHVPIVTPKDTHQNVKFRQDDELWVSVPDNYRETGKRLNFNDYELVQGKYLKSLGMTDNLERWYMPDRSISLHNQQKKTS